MSKLRQVQVDFCILTSLFLIRYKPISFALTQEMLFVAVYGERL